MAGCGEESGLAPFGTKDRAALEARAIEPAVTGEEGGVGRPPSQCQEDQLENPTCAYPRKLAMTNLLKFIIYFVGMIPQSLAPLTRTDP